MREEKNGSALIWIIIAGIILAAIAAIVYNKIIMLTTGVDESQTKTYDNAINQADDLKSKAEEKQKQLQKQMEFEY